MFDPSYFLWQHKGPLKFVIPVLLTVDAMHNAVVIWNLYNERLQVWDNLTDNDIVLDAQHTTVLAEQ